MRVSIVDPSVGILIVDGNRRAFRIIPHALVFYALHPLFIRDSLLWLFRRRLDMMVSSTISGSRRLNDGRQSKLFACR